MQSTYDQTSPQYMPKKHQLPGLEGFSVVYLLTKNAQLQWRSYRENWEMENSR